jgi:predicted O-methyltransferase YrrM
MGLLGSAKAALNHLLRPLNLRLDSRTAERAEAERLAALRRAGHFDRPVFPLLAQFSRCDPSAVLEAVKRHEPELARFSTALEPDRFSFANDYYSSPDAEVLYAMVRMHRPRRIVEVGSGHSTLLFRHAIDDAGLPAQLTSIDPFPRREIARHAHEVIRERVESLQASDLFSRLERDDMLFIDSSHELKAGNDVLHLYLNVLPSLRDGVVVHLHDIYLPFEYSSTWLIENRWTWTEQYLLQALLQDSVAFDVLWPGHYLQRTLPGFAAHFKFWRGADAKALWMRRRA